MTRRRAGVRRPSRCCWRSWRRRGRAARAGGHARCPPDERGRSRRRALRARTTRPTSAPSSGTTAWSATTRPTRSNVDLSRVPLGRGAEGQRHELQRRHHAVRAGEDPAEERRRRPTSWRPASASGRGSARTTTAIMRFEPRPGYFQPDPTLNRGRSPAISNDPRTWPDDLARQAATTRTIRAGRGSWNGYFGKRSGGRPGELHGHGRRVLRRVGLQPGQPRLARAAGSGLRDRGARLPVGEPAGRQRHLLALRHHERGHDRLRRQHHLRPLHGLGRRRLGAVVRRHLRVGRRQRVLRPNVRRRLNLVYTWDSYGHGRDLSGNCGKTGYLGYAYLETPGNPLDTRRQRRGRHHRRAARRRPGHARSSAQRRDPRLRRSRTTTWRSSRPRTARSTSARPTAPAAGGPATRTWTGPPSSTTSARDGVAETGDTGEGDGMPTARRAELRPHRPQRVATRSG